MTSTTSLHTRILVLGILVSTGLLVFLLLRFHLSLASAPEVTVVPFQVPSNLELHLRGYQRQPRLDNATQHEIAALLLRLGVLLRRQCNQTLLSDLKKAVQTACLPESDDDQLDETLSTQATQRTIPQIMHQTFTSTKLHNSYQPFIESCLGLNPGWKYYLWTNEDFQVLMARHFPSMIKTAKLFKHGLESADTMRYMALYIFGGIYVDMDVECRQPFFPALLNRTAFLDQEHPAQARMLYGRNFTAMNSVMGSTAGHPFFKQVLDRVASQKQFGKPVQTTGPTMLTEELVRYKRRAMFQRHPVELLPHYVMSPEADSSNNWELNCLDSSQNYLKNAKEKLQQNRSRNLTIREQACLALEKQKWKILSDYRPETVAVHRFLHLGYPEMVKVKGTKPPVFDAIDHFGERVHVYAKEQPLTSELKNFFS